MVLINGLTIDEINAALIALQRSKTEVVGGEKHTTVQNISVNNTGGGGGADFTPQILQLQRKDQELQGGIDALDTRVTDLENTLSSLTDNEIDYLEWDERTRTLYVYTTDGEEYSVDLPSETVTLSVVNNNVLRFTMGVGETNAPQVVDVTLPFIRSAEKGVAGGVATLDASGRVPYSQLPESAMEFKGEWDASTNTPHLEDGTGTNGDFYIVSTGGTVNFGTQAEPRLITFYPNDRVLYDGGAEEWKRLPAGQVISVNGQSGVVVLDATNINYDSNTTVKQAIDSKADASDVVQSDWTETDSSDPAFIKNKIPIWITTGQADDNMSPIDSVTDGSMRPITSNAVYDGLATKLGAVRANDFWGMAEPNGNDNTFIRGPAQGIIPYQSGGAGDGHNTLGTSSWYWGQAYIDTVNTMTVNAATVNANGYQLKRYYEIDARALSSSYFYPVTFPSTDLELDCEIHSPNVGGASPYNQNAIHFLLTCQGWSDTPRRLVILQYGIYDYGEITLGSIGWGQHGGTNCIWVRGGILYRFYSNKTPTLRTSNYTIGDETFTVGTSYSGGTNTNVGEMWTPNPSYAAYFSTSVYVGSLYIGGNQIWVS